jgi:hypothetical protein
MRKTDAKSITRCKQARIPLYIVESGIVVAGGFAGAVLLKLLYEPARMALLWSAPGNLIRSGLGIASYGGLFAGTAAGVFYCGWLRGGGNSGSGLPGFSAGWDACLRTTPGHSRGSCSGCAIPRGLSVRRRFAGDVIRSGLYCDSAAAGQSATVLRVLHWPVTYVAWTIDQVGLTRLPWWVPAFWQPQKKPAERRAH